MVPLKEGRQAGEVRYLTSSSSDESMTAWGGSGSILYRRSQEGSVLPCRVDPTTGSRLIRSSWPDLGSMLQTWNLRSPPWSRRNAMRSPAGEPPVRCA